MCGTGGAAAMIVVLFIIWVIPALISGALGGWIAEQKGRPPREGFWLGFGFLLVGCIIEALLPNATPEQIEAERRRREDEARRRQEQQAAQAERIRQREKAQAAYLAALPGNLWDGLGPLGQPIVIGLVLTLPFVAFFLWLANR